MPKIPQYTKEALDENLEKNQYKNNFFESSRKKYNIPRGTLQFKLKSPTSKLKLETTTGRHVLIVIFLLFFVYFVVFRCGHLLYIHGQ